MPRTPAAAAPAEAKNLQLRKRADRSGDRDENGRWPLAGVDVIGGVPKQHAFRYEWLEQAESEGWADVSMRQVVLHTTAGDLTYNVVGRWPSGNGVDVELVEG